MVICPKKQNNCTIDERTKGDCWIAISIAHDSGLILSTRVGKNTDQLLEELWNSTEGKTACRFWNTDGNRGYERIFSEDIEHRVDKRYTQKIERTNGIVRQQTGRWHRRQNKFGKQWEQTKVTARLVVGYFNWIWTHSHKKTTAAQRAGLTNKKWSWNDVLTYPTFH